MVLALAHFTGWSRAEIMDMDTEEFIQDVQAMKRLKDGK